MSVDSVEQDGQYAPGWKPTKEGDRVKGVVLRGAMRQGDYDPYPVLTLDTDDGEVAVHVYHTVLKGELDRIGPEEGTTLDITYLGPKTSRDGKTTYQAYRVTSDKKSAFDWGSAFGESRGDDPGASAAPPIAPAPVPPVPAAPVEAAWPDQTPTKLVPDDSVPF